MITVFVKPFFHIKEIVGKSHLKTQVKERKQQELSIMNMSNGYIRSYNLREDISYAE